LKIAWVNTIFLAFVHSMAVAALAYMAFVHFDWRTLALSGVWLLCCGLAITGGYHRLFAHQAYRAAWPLRLFYLLFGAASVQNSALKWAADHRVHHTFTDTEKDPYNIRKGFWWAHIGWVFFKDEGADPAKVPDLAADPLVRFQDRYYVPLAGLMGAFVPVAIASLWGDPLGGLLAAGFLRLALQYHVTFSINSFAHYIGSQPYSTRDTARDSFLTAIVSLGEGYHNFHHAFPFDYRNGIRAWHFDPTKWFVWAFSKAGLTHELRRATAEAVAQARRDARAG
jgi:stearoyl-CoA desaturase (delta-9 desaturase)